MSYLAQAADRVIPDLEYLERKYRKDEQHWIADQVAMRIHILKTAIKEARKQESLNVN